MENIMGAATTHGANAEISATTLAGSNALFPDMAQHAAAIMAEKSVTLPQRVLVHVGAPGEANTTSEGTHSSEKISTQTNT
jgi:hypothetical protein